MKSTNSPSRLPYLWSAFLAVFFIGMTSTLSAQTLFQDDFESDTVGTQPSNFTITNPATNTGATDDPPVASDGGPSGAIIVPFGPVSNLAGTGNGLRIYDFNSTGNSTGNVSISTDFTSTGLMRFDFNFSSDQFTGTSGNSFIRVGFGRTGMNVASNGSTGVMGRVVISRTGGSTSTFRVRDDTTDITVVNDFTLQSVHQVSIFANSDDSSTVNYVFGGSQSIAANTYDVYFDGVLVADDFDFRTGSTSGTDDIASIGLATGGSQTGPDWIFDDLVVSVPEPSSAAFLGFAAIALGLFRRRRRSF